MEMEREDVNFNRVVMAASDPQYPPLIPPFHVHEPSALIPRLIPIPHLMPPHNTHTPLCPRMSWQHAASWEAVRWGRQAGSGRAGREAWWG